MMAWIQTAAVFIGVTCVGLLGRVLVFRFIDRSSCERNLIHVLIQSLRWPSIVICVLLGFYASVYAGFARLPAQSGDVVLKILHVVLILTVIVTIARVAEGVAGHFVHQRHLNMPGTDVSFVLIRVVIWGIGILVLLNGLGVAITPILTALGVGGLAVSLALQDTLSNFFAGIQILIDKPIGLGDRVKLESGQEGVVQTIGWRSTRLRTTTQDRIIIPNSKLMQSVLYNYSQTQGPTMMNQPDGGGESRETSSIRRGA